MDHTVVLILAMAACVVCEPFHYFGHEYDRTPLGDAIDKASMKMLKEGFEESADKNVVASPLGVLTLLSLYSSGAGKASQEEIYRLLGGSDAKQVFDSYSGLSQEFAAMDSSYLTLANKIYVANRYNLVDNFTQTAKAYKSDVESIDFSDAQAAAANINRWSDDTTKGHIKSPVSPDAITSDIAAALFNIIFFQGHWNVPFQASDTTEKDFHVDKSTTVKKPTMRLLRPLFYHENKELGARAIELPYKESGFRMVVVLPDEVDGLPSVLSKLAETGVLADVFELSPARQDINLEIPKFDIKSKWDLKNILTKMGVSSLFSEAATGVVREDAVIVSKAFQEAFIKVDEEGATAGAFTGVILVPMSMPSQPPVPVQFKVDHPYIFVILYKDKILFVGTQTH